MSVERFLIPKSFDFTVTQPGSMEVVVASDHDMLIREAHEIIQSLMDVQNGCPLPSYEQAYFEANQRAGTFLNASNATKDDAWTPIEDAERVRRGGRERLDRDDIYQTMREKIARLEQECDEYRQLAQWHESLVARAQIGTPGTPSLRAYIEQLEARMAHWQEAARSVGEVDGHGWATTTADLRAQLAELAATIESIAETGITETILRAHDGFIKVGRGCLVVREEEYLALRAAQEGES